MSNTFTIFFSNAFLNPVLTMVNFGYLITLAKRWFQRRKGDAKCKLYQIEANKYNFKFNTLCVLIDYMKILLSLFPPPMQHLSTQCGLLSFMLLSCLWEPLFQFWGYFAVIGH